MYKTIILFAILFMTGFETVFAQDFDNIISSTADTLAKKIVNSKKRTVAITDFINLDESITQLGTFLSEEVSSELANLTDNQTRFRILERSKLDQILKEKNLIQSTDGSKMAKELGKLEIADILIFATITDFNGYYRVVMKLLDTKGGDALSSFKVSFVKTPSLENLNKNFIKQVPQTQITPTPIINNPILNNPVSNNPVLSNTANDAGKGDYCFKITDNYYSHSATISIYTVNGNEIEKTINVALYETSCAYELTGGVHKVEIKWYAGSYLAATEVKNIRVKKGESINNEYRYPN